MGRNCYDYYLGVTDDVAAYWIEEFMIFTVKNLNTTNPTNPTTNTPTNPTTNTPNPSTGDINVQNMSLHIYLKWLLSLMGFAVIALTGAVLISLKKSKRSV